MTVRLQSRVINSLLPTSHLSIISEKWTISIISAIERALLDTSINRERLPLALFVIRLFLYLHRSIKSIDALRLINTVGQTYMVLVNHYISVVASRFFTFNIANHVRNSTPFLLHPAKAVLTLIDYFMLN